MIFIKFLRSECGEDGHDKEDVAHTQQDRDEPALLEQGLLVVAAGGHCHGDGRGSHGGQDGGHGAREAEQDGADGVGAQSLAGHDSNRNEDAVNGLVQHDLSEQEADDKEGGAQQVAVLRTGQQGRNGVAHDVTGTGVGQGRCHGKAADVDAGGGNRNGLDGLLFSQDAAEYGEQGSGEGDLPGVDAVELAGDEQQDGTKEDDDACGLGELAQGLFVSALLGGDLNGDDGLFGGVLIAVEVGPQQGDDSQRQAGNHEVHRGQGHIGDAVAFQIAVEHAGVGDGGAEGQGTAADDGHHAQGIHGLGGADAERLAHGKAHGEDDGVNGQGTVEEVRQQEGDEQVAEVGLLKGAAGDLDDFIRKLVDELGAVQARGHHEHGHDDNVVGIGKTGQGVFAVNAAGEYQNDQGRQRSETHGKLVPRKAEHGKYEHDDTDGQCTHNYLRFFIFRSAQQVSRSAFRGVLPLQAVPLPSVYKNFTILSLLFLRLVKNRTM